MDEARSALATGVYPNRAERSLSSDVLRSCHCSHLTLLVGEGCKAVGG